MSAIKTRIMYRNLWRTGQFYLKSAEHPQWPLTDTQIDTPVMAYRSRHGIGTGNGDFFVWTGVNDKIDFDEGSGELTATLTEATYNGLTLAAEIQAKMRSAGALTYTCVYNESAAMFAISGGGPTFSILWYSGTHGKNQVSPAIMTNSADLCGFNSAADDTGGPYYQSDYRRIHSPYVYFRVDLGTAQTYNYFGLSNHNLSSNAIIRLHGSDSSSITSPDEDIITYSSGNISQFLTTARTRRYLQILVQDPTNTNSYIQLGTIWVANYWEPTFSYLVQNTSGRSDVSVVEESDARTKFAQEKTRLRTKYFPFRLTDTDEAIAESFLEEAGLTKAFVVCTNQNSPNSSSYLLQNTDLADPVYNAVNNWTWEITAEEVG
jgi:hypothetical protein